MFKRFLRFDIASNKAEISYKNRLSYFKRKIDMEAYMDKRDGECKCEVRGTLPGMLRGVKCCGMLRGSSAWSVA